MDIWRAGVAYSVYHGVYNQRPHSRRLCKEPPSTQAQHVLDEPTRITLLKLIEPNCG